MSLELAYLVLERCPLRGEMFRALLVLALDGDANDLVATSPDRLARWGRFTRGRAHLMLDQLRDEQWIVQPSRRGWRRVNRRKLMLLPPIPGKPPTKMGGYHTSLLAQRAAARVEQVAADLHSLHSFRK
jgi:hypothetical protein